MKNKDQLAAHAELRGTEFEDAAIGIGRNGSSFASGYIAGYTAAKEDAEREAWISVTEDVPETSGYYLVAANGIDQFICFYKKHHNIFYLYDRNGTEHYDLKVTHWQPLPTPPKMSQ